MTTILERLRGKVRARNEDNATRYWNTLAKIAAGKLSERAADEALEALAATMELLGKTADDAQNDVELLEQLAAAEAQAQGLDEAKKHARAVAEEEAKKRQRIEQLLLESQNLAKESEKNLSRARSRVGAIETAQSECSVIRNKLAKAGHPDSKQRTSDEDARERFEARAREIEQKLDEADRGIRAEEHTLERMKSTGERYVGAGEEVKASLDRLRGERDQLTRELTTLRHEESVRVAKSRTPGKALGGVS